MKSCPATVNVSRKTVAILPFTEKGVETDLSRELTVGTLALLRANTKKATLVEPSTIPPDLLTPKKPLDQIASALRADVVVSVDVKSFSTRPPHSIGITRATALVSCKVYDSGKLVVLNENWKIFYPPGTFEADFAEDEMNENVMREGLRKQVCKRIADLFYKHKVPWYEDETF